MAVSEVFLTALGSGSKGNAFVIECGDEAIIVDQGFCHRELVGRMKTLALLPEKLCGALLTHDHIDHCRGSRLFCDTFSLPFYTTAKTGAYLKRLGRLPEKSCFFEVGREFAVGNFSIRSFATSHDAIEPVGFVISCGGVKIGIATDLGRAAENVLRELENCDALVLESNYDKEMLMNSGRPLALKRRICGMRGHLGNRDAAALLPALLSAKTQLLLLAHVSSECNDRELIRECCDGVLQEIELPELEYAILSQDEPSARFAIKCGEVMI